MLGEIARVSATLSRVVDHGWTAEDAYLVHFETENGAAGIMQSVASDRGPMLFGTRIVGSGGTAWLEGDRVQLADASGTRDVELPADLAVEASAPPPADLMHTAYDLLHSTGIDFGPYTRLATVFRDAITGRKTATFDPQPATFADGVASMAALDAIRRSARDGTTVEVEV
jgi:predicted dehydrogenase